MLSELLKEKTKQSHQELEKIIINKIQQLNSTAAYVGILKTFYGYIAAIENSLSNISSEFLISDYQSRRKAASLLRDISFFESGTSEIFLAQDIPVTTTEDQAFGAMYVLEGSTLGGKYITKMIAERLCLEPENGFSFFNGYKENTELMWSRFKESLNNIPQNSMTIMNTVYTANQTFDKFKQWINEQ